MQQEQENNWSKPMSWCQCPTVHLCFQTSSFPVWRGADSRVWVGSSPRPRPRKQAKNKTRRKKQFNFLAQAATRLPYGESEGRGTPRRAACWSGSGSAQAKTKNPVAALTAVISLLRMIAFADLPLSPSDPSIHDMILRASLFDQAISRI